MRARTWPLAQRNSLFEKSFSITRIFEGFDNLTLELDRKGKVTKTLSQQFGYSLRFKLILLNKKSAPFLLFFLIIGSPQNLLSQINDSHCNDSLITKYEHLADSMRALRDRNSELDVLLEGLSTCPNSVVLLNKTALLYLELGDTDYNNSNKLENEDRLKFFNTGLDYAQKARRLDPFSDKATEMISTAYAAIISASGLRNQARLADSIRVYAEKTIDLNPKNDRAYHILGRWHYEVSKISSWILFFSDIFFGAAPDGNVDSAITYFKGALALDDIPIHNYWLAKAYLSKGENEKAKAFLEHIFELPDRFHNDGYFKSEAKKMLERM